MKKEMDLWSLVILGKWNPAILSPKWLGEEILDEESLAILYPVLGDAPPRFEGTRMRIMVTRERLMFWPLEDHSDRLVTIEAAATKILSTLKYTPVSGFGHNFHYVAELAQQPAVIARMFDMPDEASLGRVGQAREISVQRSILIGEHYVNITIKRDEALHFGLNFHYNVSDAESAAQLMDGIFVRNRDKGLDLLRSVYGMSLEERDSDAG